MTTTLTALLVSDQCTYLPGRRIVAPIRDLHKLTVVDVVAKAAEQFNGSGVLAIDGRAAAMLGLPWRNDQLPADKGEHPAEVELRAAGWELGKLQGWTVLHASNRPTVNLLLIDALNTDDPAAHPLITRSYLDTVAALDGWHRSTGEAWVGVSGMAGLALMRKVVRVKSRKGGRTEPTWQTKMDGGKPSEDAKEIEYRKAQWRGKPPLKRHRYFIGYDVNRMYLAAAGNVKLAPFSLRNTGKTAYRKGLAGWWLVELSAWPKSLDKQLPAPFGYVPGNSLTRWVTGPTLDLLDDLTEEGIYGGYTVLDSWTGDGATEILRSWTTTIQQASQRPEIQPTPGAVDLEALQAGFKGAYKRAWGFLDRPGTRVYRPDWAHGILAQARANLFRKVRQVGDTTKRWPCWIATDCVYYPCDTDNGVAECPEGIKLDTDGTGNLGLWTVDSVEPIPGREVSQ